MTRSIAVDRDHSIDTEAVPGAARILEAQSPTRDTEEGAPGDATSPDPVGAATNVVPLGRSEVVEVDVRSIVTQDRLRLDGESRDHVLSLAELQDRPPPIVVHRPSMRVVDGMHRLRAAQMRGDTTIPVMFYDGSDDDAFVLAVQLNTRHGMPLSRSDRHNAARRLLRTHPMWSDRMISSICGVAARTVAGLRADAGSAVRTRSRLGTDGRVRALDTSQARSRAREIFTERPEATVREVAHLTGISVGTAQDVRRRLRCAEQEIAPTPRRAPRTGHPAQPAPAPVAAQLPHPPAVEILRRDPAVRSSLAGRTMLQLLTAGSLSRDGWEQLVQNVPSHCAPLVASAARDCASAWSRFADEIRTRQEP